MTIETSTQLMHFDAARQALALAASIDEVKQIRDQAEAIRQYIRQQKGSLEMQNQAAEIKIRAERRAGEIISETELGQGRRSDLVTPCNQVELKPILSDLGVSKAQSYRWQLEAELPEEKFEELIAKTKEAQDELTSKAILKAAQELKREQERDELEAGVLPAGQFNVILADPPWQYSNSGIAGSAEHEYPTMKTEDICYLTDNQGNRVQDIFAPNAVLFLWATNPLLPDALQVVEAWGCEYKTNIVWVKDKAGQGFYVKGQHELLFICTRGSFRPDDSIYIPSVVSCPTNGHSRKPDKFYEIVEELYPEGHRVELFARNSRERWASWGNEVGE